MGNQIKVINNNITQMMLKEQIMIETMKNVMEVSEEANVQMMMQLFNKIHL